MLKKMALAAVLATTAATGAQAATVYGVDENNNLVTFNSANPGTFLSSVAITSATESFEALDFRPANGQLYGLGLDRLLYRINTTTGVATAVSATPLGIEGQSFAFDFNPVIDRIRIVSNTNDNYVVNPDTGAIQATQADVRFATGTGDPDVTAAAYTQAGFGTATSTTLYVLDTRGTTDGLYTQNAMAGANQGVLTAVGPTGVNLGNRTSFDILGSDAFVQNGRNFYSANLQTGQLSLIGRTDESLFGIAIAAVPEPATWGMMIVGVGAVGGSLRRRRTAVRFANA